MRRMPGRMIGRPGMQANGQAPPPPPPDNIAPGAAARARYARQGGRAPPPPSGMGSSASGISAGRRKMLRAGLRARDRGQQMQFMHTAPRPKNSPKDMAAAA